MNMIKAILGIIKWKKRMSKLATKPSYTEEWWKELADSCEFMPENERKGFVDSFVALTLHF